MNKTMLVLALLLCAAAARAQTPDTTAKHADTTAAKHDHDDDKEMEEVVVSTTRSSRTIAHLPTRVEVIGGEEVDEKNNMRPANVSMLLHESTGIQVQQTSATSGNASIRIQGLDGRYTQLLKDGYPSFSNFSGGLGILEIPPLDLKQVEVIKGPASTLYGAGAIAGVVNFISRTPAAKPFYQAIVNQSHVGQTNIGGFAARRRKKWGYTLLALGNRQLAYDVDGDGFTELPKSQDFTLHPHLFFYPSEKTTLSIGNSFTSGKRTGGDMRVIENGPGAAHIYLEENKTLRNTATLDVAHRLNSNGDRLVFKSSFSYFSRSIAIPAYAFEGASANSFSELSFNRNQEHSNLIVGSNVIADAFREMLRSSGSLRDFKTTTAGLFAQYTYDVTRWLKLESGFRLDAVHCANAFYRKTELVPLPRLSAFFIWNDRLSSRIGGGLGYKTPTLFTEQTEGFQYQHLLPLSGVQSERSAGGTVDVNYRTRIGGDLSLSLNHLFFFTHIGNPAMLQADGAGNFFYANVQQPVRSKGFETNVKLVYRRNLKFFAGYTFTNAKAGYLSGNRRLPLLPSSKLNLALIFEKEDFLKAGLEAYCTDRQWLSNGTHTPSFWELGAMVEKPFAHWSVFINAENLTDVRQSRYKRVVNGPDTAPIFDEIWTHTEGFVLNGGIKLKF